MPETPDHTPSDPHLSVIRPATPRLVQTAHQLGSQSPIVGKTAPEHMRFQLFDSQLARDVDPSGPLGLLRIRFSRIFAFAFNLILLPQAIHWIYMGNDVMGAAELLLFLVVNVNFLQSQRDRPYPISVPIMILSVSLVLSLAVHFLGFEGALWAYPISAVIYFVAPRREAHAYILFCTLPIILLLGREGDFGPAARFGVSIGVTATLGALMSSAISDLQRRLVMLSTTDPLTGAFNRRQMIDCLERRVARPERPERPTRTAAVLMLDIDHFKRVNDTHGHEVGDDVLRAVVTTLQHSLRNSDQVFRMGGEEFLVLLPEVNPHYVHRVAEKLRVAVGAVSIGQTGENITVSIGVALLSEITTVQAWLKHADDRLYAAKSRGRDRVVMQKKTA